MELVATIATMAHGLQILTTGDNIGRSFTTSRPQYWEQFRSVCAASEGAEGDYDADIADNILQAGLFGEIVYDWPPPPVCGVTAKPVTPQRNPRPGSSSWPENQPTG